MKSSRIGYTVLASVLAAIVLQQSGTAASYNGSPLSLLSGTYASTFSGYSIVSDSLQPFAGTGLFISDGNGNLRGMRLSTSTAMLVIIKSRGPIQLPVIEAAPMR